jgi:hypothetical protein
VKSYLESQKDAVTLDVTFARLREGLSYPGSVVLNVPGQQIQVVVQNSNYLRVAPAAQATAKQATGAPASPGGASTAAIDTLTAPIALYPDALVAQILQASTDFGAVQKFAGWMGSNASLKGSALQDAAAKAGFEACYVALAPFPQVVKMLVEKPDWTQQLGKAFTTDRTAVFDSIQRLRAAAQALGNLKTTPEQQVQTQSTSSGQQVIVIQPANPEVIYVPVYNTQTVYVQSAPPPSASSNAAGAAVIGFTAGIIIGASSNHYYGGWGAYDEAWDRREDYYEDRREYAEDRSENARENQDQRQSNAQSNQSQRQSSAQANQANPQTAASTETAQANQAQRQSTAQSSQANRQSAASASGATGQAAAQRSGGSGGLSGYQSGSSAKAQSARGSSSRSASRSGGGGGRRR